MVPGTPNPNVDWYYAKETPWREAFGLLRKLVLGCGLNEELKWGHPCFASAGKNVVLIHGFKGYCALLFFKGALLKDEHRILIQQTKSVQAARQVRFTSPEEIRKMGRVLKTYVEEAVQIEKAGLRVVMKKTDQFAVPAEFQAKLKAMPPLKKAFASLTPGRQRAYLLHFGGAKQSTTRTARVEKHVKRILAGKGLDD